MDLELDNLKKLVDTFHHSPDLLDARWKSNSDLLLAYGYALKSTGKLDGARQPLQTYVEKAGTLSPWAALLLAETHLERNAHDEALQWFEKAAELLPSGERNVEARYGAARALLQKGEAGQAAVQLQQLLTSAPRSGKRHDIRLRLAQAYEKNGQSSRPSKPSSGSMRGHPPRRRRNRPPAP